MSKKATLPPSGKYKVEERKRNPILRAMFRDSAERLRERTTEEDGKAARNLREETARNQNDGLTLDDEIAEGHQKKAHETNTAPVHKPTSIFEKALSFLPTRYLAPLGASTPKPATEGFHDLNQDLGQSQSQLESLSVVSPILPEDRKEMCLLASALKGRGKFQIPLPPETQSNSSSSTNLYQFNADRYITLEVAAASTPKVGNTAAPKTKVTVTPEDSIQPATFEIADFYTDQRSGDSVLKQDGSKLKALTTNDSKEFFELKYQLEAAYFLMQSQEIHSQLEKAFAETNYEPITLNDCVLTVKRPEIQAGRITARSAVAVTNRSLNTTEYTLTRGEERAVLIFDENNEGLWFVDGEDTFRTTEEGAQSESLHSYHSNSVSKLFKSTAQDFLASRDFEQKEPPKKPAKLPPLELATDNTPQSPRPHNHLSNALIVKQPQQEHNSLLAAKLTKKFLDILIDEQLRNFEETTPNFERTSTETQTKITLVYEYSDEFEVTETKQDGSALTYLVKNNSIDQINSWPTSIPTGGNDQRSFLTDLKHKLTARLERLETKGLVLNSESVKQPTSSGASPAKESEIILNDTDLVDDLRDVGEEIDCLLLEIDKNKQIDTTKLFKLIESLNYSEKNDPESRVVVQTIDGHEALEFLNNYHEKLATKTKADLAKSFEEAIEDIGSEKYKSPNSDFIFTLREHADDPAEDLDPNESALTALPDYFTCYFTGLTGNEIKFEAIADGETDYLLTDQKSLQELRQIKSELETFLRRCRAQEQQALATDIKELTTNYADYVTYDKETGRVLLLEEEGLTFRDGKVLDEEDFSDAIQSLILGRKIVAEIQQEAAKLRTEAQKHAAEVGLAAKRKHEEEAHKREEANRKKEHDAKVAKMQHLYKLAEELVDYEEIDDPTYGKITATREDNNDVTLTIQRKGEKKGTYTQEETYTLNQDGSSIIEDDVKRTTLEASLKTAGGSVSLEQRSLYKAIQRVFSEHAPSDSICNDVNEEGKIIFRKEPGNKFGARNKDEKPITVSAVTNNYYAEIQEGDEGLDRTAYTRNLTFKELQEEIERQEGLIKAAIRERRSAIFKAYNKINASKSNSAEQNPIGVTTNGINFTITHDNIVADRQIPKLHDLQEIQAALQAQLKEILDAEKEAEQKRQDEIRKKQEADRKLREAEEKAAKELKDAQQKFEELFAQITNNEKKYTETETSTEFENTSDSLKITSETTQTTFNKSTKTLFGITEENQTASLLELCTRLENTINLGRPRLIKRISKTADLITADATSQPVKIAKDNATTEVSLQDGITTFTFHNNGQLQIDPTGEVIPPSQTLATLQNGLKIAQKIYVYGVAERLATMRDIARRLLEIGEGLLQFDDKAVLVGEENEKILISINAEEYSLDPVENKLIITKKLGAAVEKKEIQRISDLDRINQNLRQALNIASGKKIEALFNSAAELVPYGQISYRVNPSVNHAANDEFTVTGEGNPLSKLTITTKNHTASSGLVTEISAKQESYSLTREELTHADTETAKESTHDLEKKITAAKNAVSIKQDEFRATVRNIFSNRYSDANYTLVSGDDSGKTFRKQEAHYTSHDGENFIDAGKVSQFGQGVVTDGSGTPLNFESLTRQRGLVSNIIISETDERRKRIAVTAANFQNLALKKFIKEDEATFDEANNINFVIDAEHGVHATVKLSDGTITLSDNTRATLHDLQLVDECLSNIYSRAQESFAAIQKNNKDAFELLSSISEGLLGSQNDGEYPSSTNPIFEKESSGNVTHFTLPLNGQATTLTFEARGEEIIFESPVGDDLTQHIADFYETQNDLQSKALESKLKELKADTEWVVVDNQKISLNFPPATFVQATFTTQSIGNTEYLETLNLHHSGADQKTEEASVFQIMQAQQVAQLMSDQITRRKEAAELQNAQDDFVSLFGQIVGDSGASRTYTSNNDLFQDAGDSLKMLSTDRQSEIVSFDKTTKILTGSEITPENQTEFLRTSCEFFKTVVENDRPQLNQYILKVTQLITADATTPVVITNSDTGSYTISPQGNVTRFQDSRYSQLFSVSTDTSSDTTPLSVLNDRLVEVKKIHRLGVTERIATMRTLAEKLKDKSSQTIDEKEVQVTHLAAATPDLYTLSIGDQIYTLDNDKLIAGERAAQIEKIHKLDSINKTLEQALNKAQKQELEEKLSKEAAELKAAELRSNLTKESAKTLFNSAKDLAPYGQVDKLVVNGNDNELNITSSGKSYKITRDEQGSFKLTNRSDKEEITDLKIFEDLEKSISTAKKQVATSQSKFRTAVAGIFSGRDNNAAYKIIEEHETKISSQFPDPEFNKIGARYFTYDGSNFTTSSNAGFGEGIILNRDGATVKYATLETLLGKTTKILASQGVAREEKIKTTATKLRKPELKKHIASDEVTFNQDNNAITFKIDETNKVRATVNLENGAVTLSDGQKATLHDLQLVDEVLSKIHDTAAVALAQEKNQANLAEAKKKFEEAFYTAVDQDGSADHYRGKSSGVEFFREGRLLKFKPAASTGFTAPRDPNAPKKTGEFTYDPSATIDSETLRSWTDAVLQAVKSELLRAQTEIKVTTGTSETPSDLNVFAGEAGNEVETNSYQISRTDKIITATKKGTEATSEETFSWNINSDDSSSTSLARLQKIAQFANAAFREKSEVSLATKLFAIANQLKDRGEIKSDVGVPPYFKAEVKELETGKLEIQFYHNGLFGLQCILTRDALTFSTERVAEKSIGGELSDDLGEQLKLCLTALQKAEKDFKDPVAGVFNQATEAGEYHDANNAGVALFTITNPAQYLCASGSGFTKDGSIIGGNAAPLTYSNILHQTEANNATIVAQRTRRMQQMSDLFEAFRDPTLIEYALKDKTAGVVQLNEETTQLDLTTQDGLKFSITRNQAINTLEIKRNGVLTIAIHDLQLAFNALELKFEAANSQKLSAEKTPRLSDPETNPTTPQNPQTNPTTPQNPQNPKIDPKVKPEATKQGQGTSRTPLTKPSRTLDQKTLILKQLEKEGLKKENKLNKALDKIFCMIDEDRLPTFGDLDLNTGDISVLVEHCKELGLSGRIAAWAVVDYYSRNTDKFEEREISIAAQKLNSPRDKKNTYKIISDIETTTPTTPRTGESTPSSSPVPNRELTAHLNEVRTSRDAAKKEITSSTKYYNTL